MADDFGACVVLTLDENDIPTRGVVGGQHITLAYFGDEKLSPKDHQDLVRIILDLTSIEDLDHLVQVDDEQFFGEENEAQVITFDNSSESTPVVLRELLIADLTVDLTNIFWKSVTYPVYRPHMTIAYIDGDNPPLDFEQLPWVVPVKGIAVWNGDERVEFPLKRDPVALMHYGTLHKSGRYPWGSGDNPNQRNRDFMAAVKDLRAKGLTDNQIAEGWGMTSTQFRARNSIAKNEKRKADEAEAFRLQSSGMSNVAIGKQMGINESSVRALLNPAAQARSDIHGDTVASLRRQVEEHRYLDIGAGIENHMKISQPRLATAVAQLREEGYNKYYVKVPQVGTGKFTSLKVLTPADVTYKELMENQDKIHGPSEYRPELGARPFGIQPPIQINSKRVGVRYAEDGGADADGVIYVRRGVDDVSLGKSRYAQVRIAVDGTHYLKGMAVYKDDLPDGVDLMFNTNKSNTGNKLDALKKLKDDPDNPFGAVVSQLPKLDANGNAIPHTVRSAMNIVNEEGKWHEWSPSLSSQMLSKQSPSLAKAQLEKTFQAKQAEYDEIMSLTNPVVRKSLLESFADSADSSSVHLKAAALPRQRTQVILPISTMKDTEIYAPNFKDGEKVVLVRYPHGGTFEIPELTVNNRQPEAKKTLGPRNGASAALDAVGISSKTAARLSGADFDGDTVLVIPNDSRKVKTTAPLAGLKDFDPQTAYPRYEGMKEMTPRAKQKAMGDVSNLITDMTIGGAAPHEIARAVRHSMVVIDAEKHKLNYKQSAKDNGIAELKTKYQGGARKGASTLISKASSVERVNERKDWSASGKGSIDPSTGKKVYKETGASYVDANGKTVFRKTKTTKMAEVDDARKLIGDKGTVMEHIYADHANKLKALANSARKSMIETKPHPASPSAKVVYKKEVDSLNAKLNVALKNAPVERQAQLLANSLVTSKRQANPGMEDGELKKIKGMALEEARARTGAKKIRVDITDAEWAAIQAGAISANKLSQILRNTDTEKVKALATPRSKATVMTPTVMARAKQMIASGHTQAEIAAALGIPASTLNSALKGG